jgi:two-component system sensor histidine kinase YesM
MGGFSLEGTQREGPDGGRDYPAGGATTGLSEIDGLNQAFARLAAELRQSFAEAVLLRAHKHRAQVLALQAQMNPHFMFNMLATISAMAEDGQAAGIPAIVGDLAEMMRCIASSEDGRHSLGQEFDFARLYLQCMKHRFRADLEYRVDCPPELAGVAVPRLILQPFIENAIKHCTRQRPPWKLSLAASCPSPDGGAGAAWLVAIEDNGPGFAPAVLENLQADIRRVRGLTPGLADLPELHVEGMGLINTFSRLRLKYGQDAIMEIGNRPEGGAFVHIGGRLED